MEGEWCLYYVDLTNKLILFPLQWNDIWKKRNRLGKWRGLRPSSAIIAHNNNADLDNPIWPPPKKLNIKMRYPDSKKRRPVPVRTTKWALPPHMHPTYRIDHPDFHADNRKDDEELEKEFKYGNNSK